MQEDKLNPTQCTENSDVYKCIHAAWQICHDLQQSDEHSGLNVSRHDAMAVVPESLHMFLSVLFGGQDTVNDLLVCDEETEQRLNDKVLSIAQDIIYTASKEKKLTPKHIGLALSLH